MKRETPYQFFYKNAGFSWDPKRQTKTEGKRECAHRLAQAENWLMQKPGHTVTWAFDSDADRSGIEHGGPLFECIVSVDNDTEYLGGIDLGEDGNKLDPYTRVVVAELALSLMSRVK